MKLDGIYPSILAGNLKELKKQLSAGANPNETDFLTGRTMLQVAIEKNNPEII